MLIKTTTSGPQLLSVPQRVVDAIVDEVWGDNWPYCRRDLKQCSLVCSSMAQRSAIHLLRLAKVSSEDISKFIEALRKSPRLSSAIKDLFIGEEWPSLRQIPQEHLFTVLSLLPALDILHLGWVYVLRPPPEDMPQGGARPHLSSLHLYYVDWHTAESVFAAVDGVETVHMHGDFTDGVVHVPRRREQVQTLAIHTDPEILHWAVDMFDPTTLRTLELYFSEAESIRISTYHDSFGPFFEQYGENIEHLTFGMPKHGFWPKQPTESLQNCKKLQSLTLTASQHDSWTSVYEVLASLPTGVREVRLHLCADFDEKTYEDEPDMATFDWAGLDARLVQCTELVVLDVDVVLVAEDRYWSVRRVEQERIRAQLAPRLNRILRFV